MLTADGGGGDVGWGGGFGEPVRRSGVLIAVAATAGPAGRVVASDAAALGTAGPAGILAPEKVTVLK